MEYGQFCPVAKAAEVLGERWTLLVVRELTQGATRYAQLQRGLGRISPSVLSARLKTLVEHGVVEHVVGDSAQSMEYRLTPAGKELLPIVEGLGVWGQRWVRSRMTRDELDVELLMLSVQRNFDATAFPKSHGVVAFIFSDLHGEQRRWWLVFDAPRAEVCSIPPGGSDDVRMTCTLRTLAEIYTGDTTLGAAVDSGRLEIDGSPAVVRKAHRWLRVSPLAAVRAATGQR